MVQITPLLAHEKAINKIAFNFVRRENDSIYGEFKVAGTVLTTFIYITLFNALNLMR